LEKIGTQNIGIDINNFVAIPITTAQQIFGIDSVQALAIKVKDKESIPQAIDMTEEVFQRKIG
jgi:ABC-type lipoprotein release transport system permease subunit